MRRLRTLIIPLFAATLCALSVAAVSAQSLPGVALPSAAPTALSPGVRIEGAFRTAPIAVDGVFLFRIATSNVTSGDQMSAEMRQQFIEAAITQLTAMRGNQPNSGTLYDPKTFHVAVQIDGPQAVLGATDAHHAQPFPILTVTGTDAKYHAATVRALAAQWQQKLQSALQVALQKRQPAQVEANVRSLVSALVALLVASLAVGVLLWWLRKREVGLRERVAADARAIEVAQSQEMHEEASATSARRRLGGLAIRAADPAMRLTVTRAIAGLLLWGLLLAWFLGIVWALALFPQTTALGHQLWRRVTGVIVVAIVAYMVVRVADVIATRIARGYGTSARFALPDENTRFMLRVPTIARAATAIVTVVVAIVAILTALSVTGIGANSVLTLGGIAALGITFAAQNLLRDFLNGVFVLIEDQYVVGDHITIDASSGVVEHMSLRVVQLRDSSGNLVTIPHGQVTTVINASRDWSRVDYRIGISADADARRAVEVLRATIEELARDEHWRSALLKLEWCGIESVGSSGIVVRASLKTAPLRQFETKREINARIIPAYRDADVAFGVDPKSGVQVHVIPAAR